MMKQYYVAYLYEDEKGLHAGVDIPFAQGAITYRVIVKWREDIQSLKHPGATITILSWQEILP